jgi:segregation and condensation protein B
MATSGDLAPFLKAFFDPERQMRLTRSLMETLAILAYKQPVTKPEVDFVRGVDSDYAIRRLLELGLVDVAGRADSVGRPLLYGTTQRFLDEFGLASLEALPKLREIEELLGDPNFNQERARLLALEGLDRTEPPAEMQEQAPESRVDPD